jgi:superfamily II DNA or RNA helicase
MNNLKYSIGVTGTFPKDKLYEYLLLQAYIGPVIYKLTADQLINEEKRGTPIYTIFQYMNWATDDEKETLYLLRANKNKDDIQAGNKILKQERLFVNNSYTRLKFICDKVINMKKNTLVLFGDIKYGYGNKLYEYIKNNSDKDVYYVDGTIKNENREYYKQCMEDDTSGNTVIVASINTFGEGIDLKNLWAIFLVDTSKSERIVR